jgi:hypothetical protein
MQTQTVDQDWLSAVKIDASQYGADYRPKTPEIILPLFKSNIVGGYIWGLVAGRTQTYCNWGKKDIEPEAWQHDLIRRDGTPYSPQGLEFHKQITGNSVTDRKR